MIGKKKVVDYYIMICYSSNVVIVVSTATTAQNEFDEVQDTLSLWMASLSMKIRRCFKACTQLLKQVVNK